MLFRRAQAQDVNAGGMLLNSNAISDLRFTAVPEPSSPLLVALAAASALCFCGALNGAAPGARPERDERRPGARELAHLPAPRRPRPRRLRALPCGRAHRRHAPAPRPRALESASAWLGVFAESYWGGFAPGSGGYRPLALIWLGAERALLGGSHAAMLAVGLALHGVGVVLAHRLLLRVLRAPVATGAALLAAVHPIGAEAAATVYGQVDTLAAVLGAALWLPARSSGRHGGMAAAAPAALALAALLAKESAVVTPLLAWLVDARLRGEGPRGGRQWLPGRGVLWMTAAVAAGLALRFLALGGEALPGRVAVSGAESPGARLQLVLVSLGTALRLDGAVGADDRLQPPARERARRCGQRGSVGGRLRRDGGVAARASVGRGCALRRRLARALAAAGDLDPSRSASSPPSARSTCRGLAGRCSPRRSSGRVRSASLRSPRGGGAAPPSAPRSRRSSASGSRGASPPSGALPSRSRRHTLAAHPRSPKAHAAYGLALLREALAERELALGDPVLAEARRLALRCLELNPASQEGRWALAVVADLENRPEESERLREEAARLEP